MLICQGRQQSTSSILQTNEQEPKQDPQDLLTNPDLFNVSSLVSLNDLFQARVHMGHKVGGRHPDMEPYIFGTRLGSDVFDLDLTLKLLHDALNFTAHVALRGGLILFISRNQQMLPWVESCAIDCGEFSQCRPWQPGCFTTSASYYGAITRLPDVCIFLGLHNTVFDQHEGLVEAAKMNIASVGIADSNTDPGLLSYIVPGNDDTPSAVQLYLDCFQEAINLGKQKRKELNNPGIDVPLF